MSWAVLVALITVFVNNSDWFKFNQIYQLPVGMKRRFWTFVPCPVVIARDSKSDPVSHSQNKHLLAKNKTAQYNAFEQPSHVGFSLSAFGADPVDMLDSE